MKNRSSCKGDEKPGARKAIRVAHLVSHPIQYFAPLYRELARRPEIDLTVYFYSDFSLRSFTDRYVGKEIKWDVPLLDGYKYRICPSAVGRTSSGLKRRPNWDLLAELLSGEFDAIWVMSYASSNAVLARLVALVLGIPIFFRDDTTLLTPRPLWKRATKQAVLRILLSGAWGMFVGEENKRYWINYGIDEGRLRFTPHCVDNEFFQGKAKELLPRKKEIRRQFGITDDAPVILFSGKFIEKKQPLMLLSAYARLREKIPCWLLMAGDGPLRRAMEIQIQHKAIPGVVMPGFLNQNELSLAYVSADVVALCSISETWGLVVNEAMNFGLPVVVSDRVGCATDLVKSGWNGFVVPHHDVDALTSALGRLVRDAETREVFGRRGIERVADYSVGACADGIVNALISATKCSVTDGKSQIDDAPLQSDKG